MQSVPTTPTLLDDWRWRRDRLQCEAPRVGLFAAEQVRILDYLIHRYGDSAEALRPVTAEPVGRFEINHRAIVVNHHVWREKVAGVKTRQEAEGRMAEILRRMHSCEPAEEPDVPPPSDAPASEDVASPYTWRTVCVSLRKNRRPHDAAIARALARDTAMPSTAAQYLHNRIVDPQTDDEDAARLLVEGRGRAAASHIVYAWRDLVAAGRRTRARWVLSRFLAQRDPSPTIAEGIRCSLAHSSAQVRLGALGLLRHMGTLDDIALLSDLLALPEANDEHPEERTATVRTMQRIAQAARM